mmetsp:Transcript_116117/g.339508  ORF Transcript_116117/g.339508 Transcript_116117/m.339508 type:complete len:274 (+) Transcript_116117:547-1368(+)
MDGATTDTSCLSSTFHHWFGARRTFGTQDMPERVQRLDGLQPFQAQRQLGRLTALPRLDTACMAAPYVYQWSSCACWFLRAKSRPSPRRASSTTGTSSTSSGPPRTADWTICRATVVHFFFRANSMAGSKSGQGMVTTYRWNLSFAFAVWAFAPIECWYESVWSSRPAWLSWKNSPSSRAVRWASPGRPFVAALTAEPTALFSSRPAPVSWSQSCSPTRLAVSPSSSVAFLFWLRVFLYSCTDCEMAEAPSAKEPPTDASRALAAPATEGQAL